MGKHLHRLSKQFPVVYVTGPRQSGKTTLCRATFPGFRYVSLEDLQNRQEVLEDPRGFLRRLEGLDGVVLDEVQRTPELFSYLQAHVDEERSGPLILTGSQHFLLLERISQTLAGRAALLELLPFSVGEVGRWDVPGPDQLEELDALPTLPPELPLDELLFQGLFPRIHDRGLDASVWLDGYIRTYVERDVRSVAEIANLDAFTRFLGLCAGRVGRLLNSSSLAGDVGVTHPTIRSWISVLQASYVVELLKPHHQNFRKRLVKSPKLYFVDTGLLCHLLGIRSASDLHLHPLRGSIFENFVVTELRKRFLHHAQRPPLYFWRDSNGREVDIVVDLGTRRLPIEVKSAETVATDFFKSLDHYTGLSGDAHGLLVYGGDESYVRQQHQIRAWWTLG